MINLPRQFNLLTFVSWLSLDMVICLSPSLREKYNWVELEEVGLEFLVGCKDCKGCKSKPYVRAGRTGEKFASCDLSSCQTQSLVHVFFLLYKHNGSERTIVPRRTQRFWYTSFCQCSVFCFLGLQVLVFGFRFSMFGFHVSVCRFSVSGFHFTASRFQLPARNLQFSVYGFWISVFSVRIPLFSFQL